MNITRHNYEEYFILYLDNELNAEERRRVEEFAERHPDLKEELDTLLQYKLVPDTSVQFDGKEELLKENGQSLITPANYPEWLSLYIDRELSPEEQSRVENFVAGFPAAQKELALMQQVKLVPETIVFADKGSLYRTEEKVVGSPVKWWRLAAAAVLLLGAGITAAILVNRKSPAPAEIAKQGPVQPANQTASTLPERKQQESPENKTVPAGNDPVTATTVPANTGYPVTMEKNTKPAKQVTKDNPETKTRKEESVLASIQKTGNDLPQPEFNPNVIKTDASEKAIAANTGATDGNHLPDALTNPVVTTQTATPSNIIFASDNTTDAGFDQADGKKNKNRGLFRKIARTFEKRTNINTTDDDRLLIAGLSIKLK